MGGLVFDAVLIVIMLHFLLIYEVTFFVCNNACHNIIIPVLFTQFYSSSYYFDTF